MSNNVNYHTSILIIILCYLYFKAFLTRPLSSWMKAAIKVLQRNSFSNALATSNPLSRTLDNLIVWTWSLNTNFKTS